MVQIFQVYLILLKPQTTSTSTVSAEMLGYQLNYCCSSRSPLHSVVYIEQVFQSQWLVKESPAPPTPSSPTPQTAMPSSMTFGVTRSSQASMPRTERHTGSAIHPLITSRKSNHPSIFEGGSLINIIEMGTGSGRCFKDLFERANDTGTPFPHVHFYGIDLSVPMLKRAMAWFDRRPALKAMAPIEWVEGVTKDSTDKVPQLKGGQRSGHVDRWGLQPSVQRGAAAGVSAADARCVAGW